ncbi:MAG: hypothetical protein FJZ63_06885 [Chlamydiae bacterium]|nr:hypothetical protein [Chlamydiota bacterium]
MQELVRIGPFECEPQLALPVGIFIGCLGKSKKIDDMVFALSQLNLTVRASSRVTLGLFEKESNTIYIQADYGDNEEDPLWKAAKKTWVLIFESCNATFYEGYQGVPSTNIESYVEKMELTEYCVAQRATAMIQEVKAHFPEVAGCGHLRYFDNFPAHYLEQQLAGHSQYFADAYCQITGRRDEVYRGTWKSPVIEEWRAPLKRVKSAVFREDREALKEVMSQLNGDALQNATYFLEVAGVPFQLSPKKSRNLSTASLFQEE